MRPLFLLLLALPLFAAELDSNSKKALRDTQQLLRSKSEREQYIKAHPDAATADKKAESLVGAQNKQQFYNTSAKVFGTVVERGKGDPAKQQQLVEQAMKDPEGFLKSLPPEQQQEIRELASKIEKQQPANTPRH